MDYYYFYLFIGVLKKKNNMRQMTKISPKFFGHLHNHTHLKLMSMFTAICTQGHT